MSNLVLNDCYCIEYIVTTNDTDTPNLRLNKVTKASESLSIIYQNLIRVFISYFHYQIHDNYPIGDDWLKVTNDDLNEFCITCYHAFRRFHTDGIMNIGSYSTTVSSKPCSQVDNFKIYINRYPTLFLTFRYQALWEDWNKNTVL